MMPNGCLGSTESQFEELLGKIEGLRLFLWQHCLKLGLFLLAREVLLAGFFLLLDLQRKVTGEPLLLRLAKFRAAEQQVREAVTEKDMGTAMARGLDGAIFAICNGVIACSRGGYGQLDVCPLAEPPLLEVVDQPLLDGEGASRPPEMSTEEARKLQAADQKAKDSRRPASGGGRRGAKKKR